MKRWLPLLVLAVGLGVGGFLLWPYLFTPTPPTLAVQHGKPPVKGVIDDTGFDPSVQKLLLEFDAHLNQQPWPSSRRLMIELALVKPKGLDVVIEAWLRRMHEAKLGDTAEFRQQVTADAR